MSSLLPTSKSSAVVFIPFGLGDEDLLPVTLAALAGKGRCAKVVVGCGPEEMGLGWKNAVASCRWDEGMETRFVSLRNTVEGRPIFQEVISSVISLNGEQGALLVLPGVVVPLAIDLRLAWSVIREEKTATISPLINTASFFSPAPDHAWKNLSGDEIDRFVHERGHRTHFEVPCFNPCCVYFSGESLVLLAEKIIDMQPAHSWEEGAWQCARVLRRNGFYHFLADHIFVFDNDRLRRKRLDGFWGQQEEVGWMNRAHPLTGLRCALASTLAEDARGELIPGIQDKPVQLHIMHSWGGGLSLWVRDYCKHDSRRINLVLKSIGTWGAFGQRLALYKEYHHGKPIKVWELSFPVLATSVCNREYRMILASIIEEFGVDAIFVSSLIGHSLDALDTGVKTIFIAHDYYPACPAININFGSTCRQCDGQRLAYCLTDNPLNRFFENVGADDWVAIRKQFQRIIVDNDISMICPSPSVKTHMLELFPGLQEADFTVIPHGLDLPPMVNIPAPTNAKRKKILILGSLAPHKGFALLKETIDEINLFADLYLVGCGKEGEVFSKYSGVTIIADYNHTDLVEIVGEISPDFALLLSIWPETFSYTLSELWHLNIVPVVTNLGSFTDRVDHGQNGFVFDPNGQALLAIIQKLCSNDEQLTRVRQEIKKHKTRTCRQMVTDYHALIPVSPYNQSRYFWDPGMASFHFSSTVGSGGAVIFLSNQETFPQVLIQMHEHLRGRILNARGIGRCQKKLASFFLRGLFSCLIRSARFLGRGRSV